MAYATAQELTDRVGSDALAAVSDRDWDAVVEAEAVAAALDDASAEIDSYLAARYALPIASPPAAVKRVCIDIAMYHLSGNRTTEEVEKRYKNAVSWLRDIAKGLATLGDSAAAPSGGGASFGAEARQMTRTKLSGGF
jgi:phage gp36-like protein